MQIPAPQCAPRHSAMPSHPIEYRNEFTVLLSKARCPPSLTPSTPLPPLRGWPCLRLRWENRNHETKSPVFHLQFLNLSAFSPATLQVILLPPKANTLVFWILSYWRMLFLWQEFHSDQVVRPCWFHYLGPEAIPSWGTKIPKGQRRKEEEREK